MENSEREKLLAEIEDLKKRINEQSISLSEKDKEIKRLSKAQKQTTTRLNVYDSCFSEMNKDLNGDELIQRAQNITKSAVNKGCTDKTTEVNFYMPDGTGKYFTLNENNERITIDCNEHDNTAMSEALFGGKRTVTKTYNGQYNVGDGITEPPAQNVAIIPIKTENSKIAGVAVIRNKSELISEDDVKVVNSVTNCFNSAFENRVLDAENKVLQTDKLTGLTNRHGVSNFLSKNVIAAFDNGKDVSVGFFDIDNFKKFNDTYGHDIGDKVLKTVSETVNSECRNGRDCAFRFGGEEIGVIMPGLNEKQMIPVMERIREKIAAKQIDIGNGEKVSVSVSGGISKFSEKEIAAADKNNIYSTFENGPLKRADENLYTSKENGKNQITASREVMAEYKKEQNMRKFQISPEITTPTQKLPDKKFGDLGE